MSKVLEDISRTFNEFLLLPNLTTEKCIPNNVSLKTPLVKFKKGEEPKYSANVPMVSAICIRRKNGSSSSKRRGNVIYLWCSVN